MQGQPLDDCGEAQYFLLAQGIDLGMQQLDFQFRLLVDAVIRFGVAPVIIPSVGTHYGPVAAEMVLLGFNAAMITTGASSPLAP